MTEADFVRRTIGGIDSWLTKIEELANNGALNVDSLRSLIQSWKDVVATGRAAFGLDAPSPSATIHFDGEKPLALRLAPYYLVRDGRRGLYDPETKTFTLSPEKPALPASTGEPKV